MQATQRRNMKLKRVLTSVVVFAAGTLICAGSASAQWSGSIPVSNAVEPASNSAVTRGFSAARCGSSVAVGFGDSDPGNSTSFAGYSVSTNGGRSFRDLGVLPVSTQDSGNGPDTLGGNIFSLACGDSNHFYYAAPFLAANFPAGLNCDPICSAISVSTSKDGGTSWGLPQIAAASFFDTHTLDSPSIAVDPTNPKRLYVAYLDQNFIGPFDYVFPECYGSGAEELRVVGSSDGGVTWTPHVVDHVCDTSADPERTGLFAAPKVVVSPGGKVYLAYAFHPSLPIFGAPPASNEIRFTRSLDQGNTFSTPMVVSTDAINNALPHLAVDRTNSTHRGEIYLTWSGTPTGTYTDVLVSDSVNFGLSFSFPRPISSAPAAGAGRFQTNPVISVDNDGQVAACFYATPTNSPTSSSAYSYNCATSFNHAASWTAQRIVSVAPVGFDALTSDFLLHNDGFFTVFELQTSTGRHVVGDKSDLN
jgi:hypothetical protein